MVPVDPLVHLALKVRVRLLPASTSLPVYSLSRPSLDVFAGNPQISADLSNGTVIWPVQVDCMSFFLFGVTLVRTPFVCAPIRRTKLRPNRLNSDTQRVDIIRFPLIRTLFLHFDGSRVKTFLSNSLLEGIIFLHLGRQFQNRLDPEWILLGEFLLQLGKSR